MHAKRLFFFLQGQGHSKGSYDQNMTVSTTSAELLILLLPNMVVPVCPSLICFFNRGGTEGTSSSKILCSMFVYVLFYVNLCQD